MKEAPKFNVIVLGMIFDPAKRKILLGRRENDKEIPDLEWCFPGGRVEINEDVNHTLKREIQLKTGYDVKNLGCIFSRVHPRNNNFFSVYFLCEIRSGEEKAADDLVELKWVNPDEVEEYFKQPLPKIMKEYLDNLSGKSCKSIPEED